MTPEQLEAHRVRFEQVGNKPMRLSQYKEKWIERQRYGAYENLFHLPIEIRDIERWTGYVNEQDGCWIWMGGIGSDGYALTYLRAKGLRVSRLFYALEHRAKLSRSDFVCHKCDTPSCVRPLHLWLGNAQTNHADMMSKGRHRAVFGEQGGHSKISNVQRLEIRKLHATGKFLQRELALMFGLARSGISNILNCKHDYT